MIVQEIGKTAEGRPHLMAIVTSPANHKQPREVPGHLPHGWRSPRA